MMSAMAQGTMGARMAFAGLGLAALAAPAQPQGSGQTINFTLSTRYDSHIGLIRPGMATGRSDVRISPAVLVSVARSIGRHSLSLNASAGREFYLRNSDLGSFRLSLAGQAGLNAGPCQLGLTPSFSRRQSDLYQLVYVPTGSGAARNIETVQNLAATLGCGQRIGFQPYLSASLGRGRNSNVVRAFGNYDSSSFGGGIRYANPALGQLSLGITRVFTDYPGSSGRARPSYNQTSIQASAAREVTRFLSANASIGHTRVSPDAAGPDFSGLTWSLSLTATPMSRVQLSVGTSKSVQPALLGEALYSIAQSHNVAATYALSGRTRLYASASRSRSDFRGATGTVLDLLRRTQTDRYSLGASLSPSRRMRFSLDAGVERRRSDNKLYNYSNHFVALNTHFTL